MSNQTSELARQGASSASGAGSATGSTTAERGRYHLYVAPACPWSHRAIIVHKLAGLDDVISISPLHPYRDGRGWAFTGEAFSDPLHGWAFLQEAYDATDRRFEGRITVPVLWDRHEERIVNNESADIVRMLDQVFGDGSLHPAHLADEIDALGERIYAELQNAVYEAGFARSQERLRGGRARASFETLAWLEELLGERRYLAGDGITAADWRLFPTLVRFDTVYVDHFRCNLRRLVDHPNLWALHARALPAAGDRGDGRVRPDQAPLLHDARLARAEPDHPDRPGAGLRGAARTRLSTSRLTSAPISAIAPPSANAWWKPSVSASACETSPASPAVRWVATAASSARPSEPPIWRDVLTSPEASPASVRRTPAVAAIVTGTNEKPIPAAHSSDGSSTSAR